MMARLSVSEEKAWWRDMTRFVGEKDQLLAVIGSRLDATADDLRALGKVIERWKAAFLQARHIWGLTDFLEGRCPHTPPIYFSTPYPVEGFEKCYEPVVLVYVANGTDMEATIKDLSNGLNSFRSKLAWFEHPVAYEYSQR